MVSEIGQLDGIENLRLTYAPYPQVDVYKRQASSCSKPFIQITVRYNKGMLSVLRLDCYFLPRLNKVFY